MFFCSHTCHCSRKTANAIILLCLWHRECCLHLERLLYKLAEQLDSLDEQSLMRLWGKYAQKTYSVRLSRQWELDTLVFCLIQAKHMKNQLFNYCIRRDMPEEMQEEDDGLEVARRSAEAGIVRRETPCTVSQFRPLPDDKVK